jgi:pSer/pThr/pTyr-binding forkhead associated (FHA) protein
MAFNWIQSKLKKGKKVKEQQPVVAHQATKTIFGPTPWTIWFDSGLELVCEEGRDEGRTLPLEYAFLVVGRGINTEEIRPGWLLFTEETVSRRQAVLCWNPDRDSYYLFHLKGTTNSTYVDRRSGEQWRVGVGSTVEMGYLRYRFQRRLPNWKVSPFVLNTLERLGLSPEDAPARTGWALTCIEGERKGNTFILSRRFHVVHRTANGDGLLQRGQPSEREHALLVWSEEADAYMLLHNPDAAEATYVHAARPTQTFEIFAPVPESCVEVVSGNPLLLREGDIIRIGSLHLRLHRHIQPLVEGSINHILQKGYIEKIPSVDSLLADLPARVAPQPPTPVPQVVEAVDEDDPPRGALAPEEGWVDPDRAAEYIDRIPDATHEPRPQKRPVRVAPGRVSAAPAEVDAPRRKSRNSAPPRDVPRDEPLPFDTGESTLPRPTVFNVPPTRVPRKSRVAETAPAEEDAPLAKPPSPIAESEMAAVSSPGSALRADAATARKRPAEPPRAVEEPPAPPPLATSVEARPPAPARRAGAVDLPARRAATDSRGGDEGASGERRLSLALEQNRTPTPQPVGKNEPIADEAEGDIAVYELIAVAVPGLEPGAAVAVGGSSQVDVRGRARVVIGNGPTSDLRIPDDRLLASSHALIEASGRGLVLRPLDGLPMVNKSICVKETTLREGDELRLTRNSLLRLRVVR